LNDLNNTVQGEEKIAKVKRVFSHLNLPVDIVKVTAGSPSKYAVAVNGVIEGYLEPETQETEELLGRATGLIFRSLYNDIRKHVENREILARAVYYHGVGYLGANVMADIPEESKKMPVWLKMQLISYPLHVTVSGTPFHVDHVFYSRNGEYVSEPYVMSMDEFEGLLNFCKVNGLKFKVVGKSRHFPGHTFRVIICPKEEF